MSPTKQRTLDLSPEERRARSERAKAQYRAGTFGGREIGRLGAAATAARRQAARPPEDISGWSRDRLLAAFVDVLRDLNLGYLRLKVAGSDDPAAEEVRDLLGIDYASVISEMPETLQGVPLYQDEPRFDLDWLDNTTNQLKESSK